MPVAITAHTTVATHMREAVTGNQRSNVCAVHVHEKARTAMVPTMVQFAAGVHEGHNLRHASDSGREQTLPDTHTNRA